MIHFWIDESVALSDPEIVGSVSEFTKLWRSGKKNVGVQEETARIF